jgi:hypothetical protein
MFDMWIIKIIILVVYVNVRRRKKRVEKLFKELLESYGMLLNQDGNL